MATQTRKKGICPQCGTGMNKLTSAGVPIHWCPNCAYEYTIITDPRGRVSEQYINDNFRRPNGRLYSRKMLEVQAKLCPGEKLDRHLADKLTEQTMAGIAQELGCSTGDVNYLLVQLWVNYAHIGLAAGDKLYRERDGKLTEIPT